MHSKLILLSIAFTASSTFATLPKSHAVTISNRDIPSIFRRQGCYSSEKLCGGGCIPSDSSCCSEGDGSSCPVDYYCDTQDGEPGCCPTGEQCSGSSGLCAPGSVRCGADCILESDTCDSTIAVPTFSFTESPTYSTTGYSSATQTGSTGAQCDTDEEPCGSDCMPIGYVCCEGTGYCDPGYVCVADDKCSAVGGGFGSDSTTSSPSSTSDSTFALPTDDGTTTTSAMASGPTSGDGSSSSSSSGDVSAGRRTWSPLSGYASLLIDILPFGMLFI